MTKHDIDTFGVILKDKLADASRTLQSRESIMIEKSADQLDEIERAVARDIAIQYLDRESRLLRDVRSALGRIDACTFGTCLHCEEDISRRRLEAMPWARLCLPCQEAADRGDQGVIETVESWFADAA
jgi:RNA polymerase-binding transcription factor